MEQQPHVAGSIDRLLLDNQVLLTSQTCPLLYGAYRAYRAHRAPAGAPVRQGIGRPLIDGIVAAAAAKNAQPLAQLLALTRWCSRIPLDYPLGGRATAAGFYGDFGTFGWGGDEEAIIRKGSPWPLEIARVLATLLQAAGFPSRLVFLYRHDPPQIHTVVEAEALGGWAVCDACANRCYVWPHHGYASAADLQQQPRLVDQSPEHGHNPYVDSAFYRTVAIVDYVSGVGPTEWYELLPAGGEHANLLQEAARVFAAK